MDIISKLILKDMIADEIMVSGYENYVDACSKKEKYALIKHHLLVCIELSDWLADCSFYLFMCSISIRI